MISALPIKVNKAKRARNARGAANLSEFGLTLYILFFLILVPVVDLGCLFIAAATQYLATNDFAAKASSQPDYVNSLNAMFAETQQFQSLGMAKFMNMTPQGGYVGCGDDLYVVATDISSGSVTKSTANNPLAQSVDTAKNFYEFSIKSTYSFKPVLSLSGIPVLGDIPALGKPVTLSFVANRPVEHPGGLTQNGSNANQTSVAFLNRTQSASGLPSTGSSTDWRIPNIYQRIKEAGQTVVSVNVVVVMGNDPNWTSGSVTVNPSQKIWIDTQAIGVWSVGGSEPSTDANGLGMAYNPQRIAPSLADGALIGQIGSGTPFFLGNNQTNYSVSGTGTLSLVNNDATSAFNDNTGAQVVRIIMTQ